MRLWSLHPQYLDTQGLLAVWREALLAQKVLRGETRGYRHHPQLTRFRSQQAPVDAVAAYLRAIHAESLRRGYQFDVRKIPADHQNVEIPCTRGQLRFEWEHLKAKLQQRHPAQFAELLAVQQPRPHPMFRVIAGRVEAWETGRSRV